MAVLWMQTPAYRRMNPIRAQLRGYAARRFSRLSRESGFFTDAANCRRPGVSDLRPLDAGATAASVPAGPARRGGCRGEVLGDRNLDHDGTVRRERFPDSVANLFRALHVHPPRAIHLGEL